MDENEWPIPGDKDAPEENAPLTDEEFIGLATTPEQHETNAHRTQVVEECRRMMSEIPRSRICAEELEKVFVHAYDAAREYLTREYVDEDGTDHVLLVEPATATEDPREIKYRKIAKAEIHEDGEVEIDDNAKVGLTDGPNEEGAYVAAWVWVDNPDYKENKNGRENP